MNCSYSLKQTIVTIFSEKRTQFIDQILKFCSSTFLLNIIIPRGLIYTDLKETRYRQFTLDLSTLTLGKVHSNENYYMFTKEIRYEKIFEQFPMKKGTKLDILQSFFFQ